MSWKFNTKKFIKDVLNDRYAHLKTAIQSMAKVFLGLFFGAIKEMSGDRHTLACCLSKHRSSLEAGKKQLGVWLQYVYCLIEVLLYPSFGAPLVLFLPPHGDLETSRMAHGDVMEEHAVCNLCSLSNEARCVASRTYIHEMVNPYLFSVVSIVLAIISSTKRIICNTDIYGTD